MYVLAPNTDDCSFTKLLCLDISLENQVQWPYENYNGSNGSIHEVVASNDSSPLRPIEASGLSAEDDCNVRDWPLNYSGATSTATSISNFSFENGSSNDVDYEEHPETPTSPSDASDPISGSSCPHYGPRPEQDSVGQIENLSLRSKLGIITSAGISSHAYGTSCVLEDAFNGCNACITQEDAEGELRAYVGSKGYATRWERGSVLRYTVCTETFPSPQWATLVAREVETAVLMWPDIGIHFKKVGRDEKVTFAIRYFPKPDDGRSNVYARAFFPDNTRGILFVNVYKFALHPANVEFLANIFAHELGHVLGLAHEFAVKSSFLIGKENEGSIMNYHKHLSELQVGVQDREELMSHYECDGRQHEGLYIKDIKPRLFPVPRSHENRVRRRRSASSQLCRNHRTARIHSRSNPSLTRQNGKCLVSSQIWSPFNVRFCCGLMLFTSLVGCAFLIRQM